ncbi:unnamed protein product [marine sediment metagenome]|uniref:Uncharacterized protein n=1 Tax=marine sediment metagenome TaxID=412755 RepID=X0TCS1_9ZZZZ
MNEETRELLLECKKAGYEFVAICCMDKRVPISVKLEKVGERKYSNMPSGGSYWGESAVQNKGDTPRYPPTVVCAAPNRRDTGRPAIWDICKNSTLTAALDWGGLGCGESHQIRPNHNLDRGCYDLKELA